MWAHLSVAMLPLVAHRATSTLRQGEFRFLSDLIFRRFRLPLCLPHLFWRRGDRRDRAEKHGAGRRLSLISCCNFKGGKPMSERISKKRLVVTALAAGFALVLGASRAQAVDDNWGPGTPPMVPVTKVPITCNFAVPNTTNF